jgi:hypothetical protein
LIQAVLSDCAVARTTVVLHTRTIKNQMSPPVCILAQ